MAKEVLSVVLPSYNEEENLPLVYNQLIKYIDTKRFDYEIIFVNDGSMDGTWSSIQKLVSKDKRIRGIDLSRNCGHAAALEAGLQRATGDIVIMMDADLQHPPSLIPTLISKYDKGYDVVNTVRLATEQAGVIKNITSKAFYRLINCISDMKLHEGEADFRLLSRKALDALNSLPETPKFYRGLVNWIGFNVDRVEYKAGCRKYGKSSYTLKKMLELARMGITSFSMKPLKVIFTAGVVLSMVALIVLIAMLIIKFFINSELISYNAILTDGLLLTTGILTIFQGVIALYLVDIFRTTKGRPTYIVKSEVNARGKK